jgi:cytochrome c oxidase cbb3-type subunit 3
MRRSPPRASFRALSAPLALATALASIACDRAPDAASLREWTPADHDRVEEKQRLATGQAASGRKGDNSAQLVELTWRQQCLPCHGMLGKGDGPNAAMFKPADLTKEEWQSKVKDEEIALVIKNGKNKMPKFTDLPPEVIVGLVARIRAASGK